MRLNNSKYVFTDIYEDWLLLEQYGNTKAKLLNQALKSQEAMYNSIEITGTMDMFKVNAAVNARYELPAGTFTYVYDNRQEKENTNIIPYYNVKDYAEKYKYELPVSLLEIMRNSKIFNRRLIFSIGEYRFLKLRLIETTSKFIIFCIYADHLDGIRNTMMMQLMANKTPWSLYSEPQSDIYSVSAALLNLFVDNTIPLSKFTDSKIFPRPTKLNHWGFYVTANNDNPNLLLHTNTKCVLHNTTQSFEFDPAFKTYALNNLNQVNCYAFNEYCKSGTMYISATNIPESVYSIQIPFVKNPVYIKNISIFKYDSLNKVKREKIHPTITSPTADIFFITLPRGDYILEYYEVLDADTQYDDNFNIIKGTYGNQFATKYANRSIPTETYAYKPLTDYFVDYDDYLKSPLYGNLKAYFIDKYNKIIMDNPLRYLDYVKAYMDYHPNVIPATYDLNDPDNKYIFNRSIMNTSNRSNIASDIVTFTEAHTYIEFTNDSEVNRGCTLFIDGRRMNPTLVKTIHGITSVYIKKSLLTATSTIIIDMYLISEALQYSKYSSKIKFTSTGMQYQFPEANNFGDVPIHYQGLMYFNYITKEYYKNNEIQLALDVPTYEIEHMGKKDPEIVVGVDPTMYFITSDLKYYTLKNNKYVVVPVGTESINVPTYDTETNGCIYGRKEIDSKNIKISTNNITVINTDIGITNTNVFYTTSQIVNVGQSASISIPSFPGIVDTKELNKRINVYINGYKIKDADITYTAPTRYGDPLLVNIANITPSNNIEIIIDYIPSYYQTHYYEFKESINDQGLFSIGPIRNPIYPKYAQLYINGLRANSKYLYNTDLMEVYKVDSKTGVKVADTIEIVTPMLDSFTGYNNIPTNPGNIGKGDSNIPDFLSLDKSLSAQFYQDTGNKLTPREKCDFLNFAYNMQGTKRPTPIYPPEPPAPPRNDRMGYPPDYPYYPDRPPMNP